MQGKNDGVLHWARSAKKGTELAPAEPPEGLAIATVSASSLLPFSCACAGAGAALPTPPSSNNASLLVPRFVCFSVPALTLDPPLPTPIVGRGGMLLG